MSSSPQGDAPIIVFKEVTHVAASVQDEIREEASMEEERRKVPSKATEAREVDGLKPAAPMDWSHRLRRRR